MRIRLTQTLGCTTSPLYDLLSLATSSTTRLQSIYEVDAGPASRCHPQGLMHLANHHGLAGTLRPRSLVSIPRTSSDDATTWQAARPIEANCVVRRMKVAAAPNLDIGGRGEASSRLRHHRTALRRPFHSSLMSGILLSGATRCFARRGS